MLRNQVVGNYIKSTYSEGIYLEYNKRSIVLGNVIEDGNNGNTAYSALAINYGERNIVKGNQVESLTTHGISLQNTVRNIVKNNVIKAAAHGIILGASSNYNLVEANVIEFGWNPIVIVDSSYNTIFLNDCNGGIQVIGDSTANVIKHNRGYVTENSGIATILSGQTSVTVAHGLVATPSKVVVTPRGNIGSVWVSARNATNITISCSSAPTTNTMVDWYAEV
jgi:parallel beta-helix repeat protein